MNTRADQHPAERDSGDVAITDEVLAAAARRDRRAFSPLYERYAARVYRYALACTGSEELAEEELAEEVLGETMLAAIEGLARWDPRRGSFAGWLRLGGAGRRPIPVAELPGASSADTGHPHLR